MQILTRIPYLVSLFLLVYMPLHIFLSQSLSQLTGGLDAWKIGKDALLFLATMFTICLVYRRGSQIRAFNILVLGTVLYGLLHLLLWVANPELFDKSAILGTIYNVRLPFFAILGAGAVLLYKPKFAFSSVLKVLLIVSTVVSALGVLQYFLPPDTLTHFGYSLERGVRAAFFIDDNPEYFRIMSTLREPNALGAYLLLPTAALLTLFIRVKEGSKRQMISGAFGLHVLAVFLTFSRSAWLALAVVLLLVLYWQFSAHIHSLLKKFWPAFALLVLLVGVIGFTLKDSHFFQQYIIHSNPNETVEDLDSNDYHSLLVKQGFEGIQKEPLGHGPGTAGIVSIQNPGGGQLTENYYIQIGYEVGVLGLALFIAFNIWLYLKIRHSRDQVIRTVFLASFWGYVLTNMLLHTWSNEAVAAQWWALAGMAIATSPTADKLPPKTTKLS